MSDEIYLWSTALRQAMKRNRRDAHNRYLQLATVRSDGSPAVRNLVCRGFCSATLQLLMCTDARSSKVSDVATNPQAEICWYLTHTREQFRLRGRISVIGPGGPDQQQRLSMWESLSDTAKQQFFWPHPGEPLARELPALPAAEDGPPESFLLLALTPLEVDHLMLRGEPQRRFISTLNEQGTWSSTAVNP